MTAIDCAIAAWPLVVGVAASVAAVILRNALRGPRKEPPAPLPVARTVRR